MGTTTTGGQKPPPPPKRLALFFDGTWNAADSGGNETNVTRLARAVRACVKHWSGNNGPQLFCANPSRESDSVTAVLMPEGHDADRFRKLVLSAFDMSLGQGLSKLAGKVFRIGHLGSFNDLMLMGEPEN